MTTLFKKNDKVTRLDVDNSHVYTVSDLEETEGSTYYTIVRHSSPNKPHWTICREDELLLSEQS